MGKETELRFKTSKNYNVFDLISDAPRVLQAGMFHPKDDEVVFIVITDRLKDVVATTREFKLDIMNQMATVSSAFYDYMRGLEARNVEC